MIRIAAILAFAGALAVVTRDDFGQHAWHSDVERLSEPALYDFVRFVFEAVTGVQ